DVLNDLEADFLSKINKISFKDDIFRLHLEEGGDVNLGRNSSLEDKFAILNSILENNKEEEIDYINLQVIKHPVIKFK
ncbi:MAG: cell division protein FtsQ/DivIB, partial [Halanaerobium sp.]